MDNPKPKRHWFRFSLRTMFVLVTVSGFGSWYVVHQKWIQDRHWAVMHDLAGDYEIAQQSEVIDSYWQNLRGEGYNPAPLSLRLLGERGIGFIYIRITTNAANDEARAAKYKRLFPESEVIVRKLSYSPHARSRELLKMSR
jgi:hypothetical protein